ncbi:MAG: Lrp/AsnC family transcriptional regulator [Candidatus Hadarchaeales archaeon]
MDEIEAKIALQLLRDARQPIKDIARKVGVTRQTAAKKMASLQESGIIRGFVARMDRGRLGLGTMAYIFLEEDPSARLREETERTVRGWPEVSAFHRIFGRHSSILEVLVRNDAELKRLVKRLHRLKGVKGTETFIVHSTVKDDPESPVADAIMREFR